MNQLILISKINIAHYRRRRAAERDKNKREIIRRLLGEEEFRLAILNDMQADEDLAQLLCLATLRSVEIFDQAQPEEVRAENEVKFAAILAQMPFGIGLIDGAGQCIVVNAAMRCFVPEQIPSRDLRHIRQ